MGVLKDNMIKHMTIRGYAPKTIKTYIGCVHVFAHHFNKSPLLISGTEIEEFFLHLRQGGRSDSTIRLYYESIKYFYRMHRQEERVPYLKLRGRKRILPVVLSEEEVLRLLETPTKLMDKTMFYLLYSSGLRVSEAINLNREDIDFHRRTIHVRNGKNGKDRYVILSEEAQRVLQEYYRVCMPGRIVFPSPVIASRRISTDWVRQHLQKTAVRAQIQKRIRTHTLRHCFATHLAETGTNLFHIMQLLGHSQIQTTMVYLHTQRDLLPQVISPLDTFLQLKKRTTAGRVNGELFRESA